MVTTETFIRTDTYELSVDRARRLLRITMKGFISVEAFDAFEGQFRKTMDRLGWEPGTYVCLVDNRHRDIISQDMVQRIQRFAKGTIQPARLAVLSGSALAALQSKRIDPQNQVFTIESEAMDWLSDAIAPDAGPE